MTVDDNGSGLYTTRLGHGDALHVSDFDPDRPGLEVFMPHESPGSNGGIGASFRDAATGAIIWSTPATSDVGRGAMMDIDPRFDGAEGWAVNRGDIYTSDGAVATPRGNAFNNFGVWWEGGLLRQMLDNTTIARWNWDWAAIGGGRQNLLTAWQQGAAQSNGTKATPALSGDILGDWREEVIWKNTDSTALLLFTTTVSASGRLHTLIHDPTYRMAIAWQNVAYNQPPHPGFFLGHDMPTPPRSPIWKGDLVWKGGTSPQIWSAGSNRFKSSPTATDTVAYTNGSSGSSTAFDLGTRSLGSRSGSAYSLGSLTGSPGSSLSGANGYNSAVTYTLGGNNLSSTFSGSIINGNTASNAGNITHIIKTGSGVLTLAGHSSHTGNTTVQSGTLEITGTLAATPTTIENNGRLTGSGSIAGRVTSHGSVSPVGTLTFGNGLTTSPTSRLEFQLGSAPNHIDVFGNLTLSGSIEISASPGIATGVYPLITYTSLPSFGSVELVTDPGDFTCELDLTTPGQVNAIITSTLSAFEQWQILHFGSMDNPLAQADEDPDGDGQSNRIEFIAGTNPNNSFSVFKVEITPATGGAFMLTWPSVPGKSYVILESTNPSSGWLPLHSLEAGPGDTSTHLLPGPHQGTRFFRIQVE